MLSGWKIICWSVPLLCIVFQAISGEPVAAVTDAGISSTGDELKIEHQEHVNVTTETDNKLPESSTASKTWWLDISAVDKFRTLSLPHSTYKKWSSLSLLEKLPYLIDRSFLVDVKNSYLQYCLLNSDSDCALQGVPLEAFLQHGGEFNTADKITTFFKDCDNSLIDLGPNEKGNEMVSWVEYVVCRGYFDAAGNAHDVSEFDFLENIVIMDYQRILSDPNHPMVLELIARDEL